MKEEFVTFEKFNNQNSAKELGALIAEQNIDFILEDNSLTFDPAFANNDFGKEYCIKIRKSDFEKANKVLVEIAENEINDVDKDYYLFGFTVDELVDVVSKSDEWNKFDVSLAKKILKNKGRELTPEEIEKIKQQRILELSQPEEGQKIYIILGYLTAFLGGFLGIFIGWHLLTYKKTLPNGNRIFAYSTNDRKQGNRITIIGGISLVFWIIIRIFY